MLNSKVLVAATLALAASTSFAKGLPSAVALDPYCDQVTNIVANGDGSYTANWDENAACGGAGYDVPSYGFGTKKLAGTGKLGVQFGTASYPAYSLNWSITLNTDGSYQILDAAGYVVLAGSWSQAVAGVRGTGAQMSKSLK